MRMSFEVSEYVLEVIGSTEVSPQEKGVISYYHIFFYIIVYGILLIYQKLR